MIILCFFAEMIVCFVASAGRCVCRFLLSVRCGGGVLFMLCLFIGYVVWLWLWAHWLAIRLAIRLAAGYSACLLAICLGACAGPLGDY